MTVLYDDRDGEMVPLTPEEVSLILSPPSVPAQVLMHKVQKAALLTPWGDGNLKDAIEAAFTRLASPSDVLARIEWDKAPNLVRDGATTLAVMALIGMTDGQRDDLLLFAQSLP